VTVAPPPLSAFPPLSALPDAAELATEAADVALALLIPAEARMSSAVGSWPLPAEKKTN